jgi:hypothetical protein
LAAAAEEDDEDAPAKVIDPDMDEDEMEHEEVTAELDASAVDQAPLELDDDEESDPINQGTGGADVPEGFSEQELDDDDPTAGDDEVPFLEDDEDLIDDDLGDIPGPDDDDIDPR